MPLLYKNRRFSIESLVDELRRLPTELRFSTVKDLVLSADPDTRSQSMEVAKALEHPQTAQFCIALLEDPDWRVRSTACEFVYLADLAVPVSKLLQLVATDNQEYVRFYAALALVKVASEAEIPANCAAR